MPEGLIPVHFFLAILLRTVDSVGVCSILLPCMEMAGTHRNRRQDYTVEARQHAARRGCHERSLQDAENLLAAAATTTVQN